jgi:uncharacterized membrane protein
MSVDDDVKETLRIEAFSDGVFAIAITLLVLELKVPHGLGPNDSLLRALGDAWPSYAAFLVSFATILIMWVNHHRLFTLIHRSDNRLLLFNGVVLFMITTVPFPTTLLAAYFRTPQGHTAAMIYTGHAFLISLAYTTLWRYSTSGTGRLLGPDADRVAVHAIGRQYRFGPLLYLASLGVAAFSVAGSVVLDAALAVFFALPPRYLAEQSAQRGHS